VEGPRTNPDLRSEEEEEDETLSGPPPLLEAIQLQFRTEPKVPLIKLQVPLKKFPRQLIRLLPNTKILLIYLLRLLDHVVNFNPLGQTHLLLDQELGLCLKGM
jgi:hypothetical protein